MNLRRAELLLKTLTEESKWINSEILINSQAMLNLAKAEGEEAGIQYQEYSQQLDILREMSKANVDQMKQSQAQSMQPQQQPQQEQPMQ